MLSRHSSCKLPSHGFAILSGLGSWSADCLVLAAHFCRFGRLPDAVPAKMRETFGGKATFGEKTCADRSTAEEDHPDRANAAFAEIGRLMQSGILQLLIHHVTPMQVKLASSSPGKSLSAPWIAHSDPIVHTRHVMHSSCINVWSLRDRSLPVMQDLWQLVRGLLKSGGSGHAIGGGCIFRVLAVGLS